MVPGAPCTILPDGDFEPAPFSRRPNFHYDPLREVYGPGVPGLVQVGSHYSCLPMGISLPTTLIKVVLFFTWMVYPLLVWVLAYLMRKNARINIGIGYMMHVVFHTYQHSGEDKEQMRAAGKQMAHIIAHDAYAAGNKIYLMQYWIPGALVVAVINRVVQVYLPRMGPSLARVLLGTIAVAIFAGLLFLLKQQQQIVYGTAELLFALWSCAFSLSRMGDTMSGSVLIGLLTSIYLMIRAGDNITKGIEQFRLKKRSVLTSLKRLSKLEGVSKYRVWFAAIVRATGELFLVQTQSFGDKHLILSKPPIDRDAKYTGILFSGGDADGLWAVKNPRSEQKTFAGYELKMVEGSYKIFLNPKPENFIGTAPPPEPSTAV